MYIGRRWDKPLLAFGVWRVEVERAEGGRGWFTVDISDYS